MATSVWVDACDLPAAENLSEIYVHDLVATARIRCGRRYTSGWATERSRTPAATVTARALGETVLPFLMSSRARRVFTPSQRAFTLWTVRIPVVSSVFDAIVPRRQWGTGRSGRTAARINRVGSVRPADVRHGSRTGWTDGPESPEPARVTSMRSGVGRI